LKHCSRNRDYDRGVAKLTQPPAESGELNGKSRQAIAIEKWYYRQRLPYLQPFEGEGSNKRRPELGGSKTFQGCLADIVTRPTQ
jgi:hypothetical protein